jgi:hypothetical protein
MAERPAERLANSKETAMLNRACLAAALLTSTFASAAGSENAPVATSHYKALKLPAPLSSGTWAILDRDGANRRVVPYLSSLAGGERGTGLIVSPPFQIAVDTIDFTVCGHDGQGGGRGENFVALVAAETGRTLEKTMAPCADPMQERSWDVAERKGSQVRIEVHDGIAEGSYAWIGVGRIDAGPQMTVDFKKDMPADWEVRLRPVQQRTELVEGGVPFLRCPAVFTIVPNAGTTDIPCGFAAERLFLLGCTVGAGRALQVYGEIEIVYRDGDAERFPLMYGFTLDAELKLLTNSKAMHLRPSADPHQHYLVLKPRSEVIEKVSLRRNPEYPVVPRITAITCHTAATSDHLVRLPEGQLSSEEETWIQAHTISASSPDMDDIVAEIRRVYSNVADF